ncbi:MAG: hypothetical protein ABI629_08060 [bacterium]
MTIVARWACALLLLATSARAACVGDCDGNGEVSVSELIASVSILLGSASLDSCSAIDADGNGAVSVDELVAAVNNALGGCRADGTPTPPSPTVTSTAMPTASAPPTLTATPATGPRVVFFGIASADDNVRMPSSTPPDAPPIYELPFGFGFRLVVEAIHGSAGAMPGPSSFNDSGPPDLQVEVSRPLGNGSGAVCDGGSPSFGGVPAIDPPRFDASDEVVDALNDMGCRFIDGTGQAVRRTCVASCVRDQRSDYNCVNADTEAQFCALVDNPLAFPGGDTLVTVRVRDSLGNLGAPAQLIVRIQQ